MTRRSMTLCLCSVLLLPAVAQAAGAGDGPHLVMVIAEDEYHTDQTLPPFAELNLAQYFRITRLEPAPDNRHHVPGLEALDSADLLFLSVRRRPLVPEDLNAIRRYLERGRPLAAIRTSSHAFCLRDSPPAEGLAAWRDFDETILGCHYRNHHGDRVQTFVRAEPAAAAHPILLGIPLDEFPVFGSLYICGPLTSATTLLMTGRAEQLQPREPVAWVSATPQGGRVFYTSLGHPQDFTLPNVVRLLRNGICWAADVPVPTTAPHVLVNVPAR